MSNKQEATLLLRIKQSGQAILDRFVFTLGDVINVAKGAALAIKDFAMRGAELDAVRGAFEGLAAAQGQSADQMLAKMRELSQGTITDLELMKKANQALMLGLPVDKFGDMLTVARASARATGESMEFMLNSIVTGLGRGSKLMLDNLGIVFDIDKAYDQYAAGLGKTAEQLTEAEKKQAFINKALEIGVANAEKAGGATLTLSERFQQLNVSYQNFMTNLSSGMGPAFLTILDSFQEFAAAIEVSVSAADILVGALEAISVTTYSFIQGMKSLGTQLAVLLVASGEAVAEGLKGNFGKAKQIMKAAFAENEQISNEANLKAMQRDSEIEDARANAKQASFDRQADMLRKAQQQEAAEKEQFNKAMADKEAEAALSSQERRMLQYEMERAEREGNELAKVQAQIRSMDEEIQNEQNHQKRMELIKKRGALVEVEIEKLKNAEMERARSGFLAHMSQLQNSHNSAIAALGKAAALTQIWFNTLKAASDGLAWGTAIGGPALGLAFKATAYAAGAALAAQASGIKLAEGGIVRATPGGVPAIIGEGGRDEAVIPLDDDRTRERLGMGGRMEVHFHGPILGDESQAYEFARALDKQFLKLRQRNESVSFDSDVF